MADEDPIPDKRVKVNPGAAWGIMLSIASILVAVGSLLTTVAGHERRLDALEQQDKQKTEMLAEVRSDIKVLLERTKQ